MCTSRERVLTRTPRGNKDPGVWFLHKFSINPLVLSPLTLQHLVPLSSETLQVLLGKLSLLSWGISPVDIFSCFFHLNQLHILYVISRFLKKDLLTSLTRCFLLYLFIPLGFYLFPYHYVSSVLRRSRYKHLCYFCYVYPKEKYKILNKNN